MKTLYVFPSEEAAADHFDAVQEAYRREGLGGLIKSPLGVAMLAGVLEGGPPPEISLRREWQLRYERDDGRLWKRFGDGLRRRTMARLGRPIRTYRCEACGGVFEYVDGWGDDEALAESLATFGFVPAPEDAATICDDCWKRFVPWARENGLVVDDA